MPYTVMLVDDNVPVRLLLADVVRNAGFVVCGEASDGLEAIDMASRLNPDLVVLDFSMPRLNGAETASVLKRERPKVPIILLSLYADRIGSAIQKATTVDLVISKAEGVDNLLNAMHRLLGIQKVEGNRKQPYEKPTLTRHLINREEQDTVPAGEHGQNIGIGRKIRGVALHSQMSYDGFEEVQRQLETILLELKTTTDLDRRKMLLRETNRLVLRAEEISKISKN